MSLLRNACFAGALSFSVVSCAPSGFVKGVTDSHCGSTVVVTDQATCNTPSDGGVLEEAMPEARFNGEADDDDCKYHVKVTSTPPSVGADVTFTVTVTRKSDGAVAAGLETDLVATLDDTHPAPNAPTVTTETKPGTSTIGPVRFDRSGDWALELHLAHDCTDVDEASPHGHVTFVYAVP